MDKNNIIEVDISEIPIELGQTIEERVKNWLDLLNKGIRLIDKSKTTTKTFQYCWCNCFTCPYNKNNWYYSSTNNSANTVSYTYSCNSDNITTCTYNKDETPTSNT